MDHAQRIAQAKVETICRLLSTDVRPDLFCDGQLAAVVESGHIRALLERIGPGPHASSVPSPS